MNEEHKTAVFVAAAVLLAALAFLLVPGRRAPALFDDQGELFYPEFETLACAQLEVVSFDADSGAPRMFSVKYTDGQWLIPSHEDYPAEADQQLAKTVAVVNGLRKGVIRTDKEKDHAGYGVVDPLDETRLSPKGVGKRLALKDKTGKVLADYIIGEWVEGGSGQYYVRTPDSNRVYACKLSAPTLSTRFADWVETDVLKLGGADIRTVTVDKYSIDEESGRIVPGEVLVIERNEEDTEWLFQGELAEDEELKQDQVRTMVSTLKGLTLVGVRRKPAGIIGAVRRAAEGKPLSVQDQLQLNLFLPSVGYFLAPAGAGKLGIVSNEGETRVACADGVTYRLLFGEVVYGEPDEISAAPDKEDEEPAEDEGRDEQDKGAEHRYLWVTVDFDESRVRKPEEPVKPEPAEEPPPADEEEQPEAEAEAEEEAEPDEDAAPAEDEGDDEVEAAEDDAEPADGKDPLEEYEEAREKYEQDMKEYDEKLKKGRERADELAKRFDQWYYLVSADADKKLRLSREDLIEKKEEEDPEQPAEEGDDMPEADSETPDEGEDEGDNLPEGEIETPDEGDALDE